MKIEFTMMEKNYMVDILERVLKMQIDEKGTSIWEVKTMEKTIKLFKEIR